MKFLLTTHATMKRYNNDKWWIDSNMIEPMRIEADSVRQALSEYADTLDDHGISISKHALSHPNKMYCDDKDGVSRQVGYVITASTEFDKGDYAGWSKQYIDLWVEIIRIEDAFEAA